MLAGTPTAPAQSLLLLVSTNVIARRMLRVCTTNPGLCSVHPDKPLVYGEKAFMVPRGDVTFQQYVNQFLHLSKANGDYQAVIDKWLK